MKPLAGQTWERDGKQREVVRVEDRCDTTFDVWWRRPGKKHETLCWCSTWMEWASKAQLVEEQQ